MKRLPFERPTNYYDERLFPIDEKICSLLNERKELSNQNPGCPPNEIISNWAGKYGFYEEYLQTLFSTMRQEDYFKPRIEPSEFIKHVPVFKTFENEGIMYTVTFVRQYSNASVIYLYIDWDATNNALNDLDNHRFFELSIDDTFDCRSEGGGGTQGHISNNFIVSPPLPDHFSGIELVFKEGLPFSDNPTGLEFVIQLD
ncbi:hypothetical protein [Peribacillus loiseleuriae]|uniref:Uncharacterized protein n=1 Tax=Peribacillus loiseleuriae TaxID=1679170 RepID=A0A0K9GXR2_9BACI|nr:hypothetical protein [Peribacillus loiseleuriae]KMY51448.1 hypothetical protein AC625_19455 [Peribacillus loiseleuriae]